MATLPDLQAQLALLQAENAALKAKQSEAQTIRFKVSGKGAVSAYGLGQFPVTLYRAQWLRLLDKSEALKAFMLANAKLMAEKGVAPSPELVAHAKVVAAAAAARPARA